MKEPKFCEMCNHAPCVCDRNNHDPVDADQATLERIYSNPDYDADHDHSMDH